MSREVRLEDGNGSTKETFTHLKSRGEYEFGKQDQMSMWIPRSEANNASFDEGFDEVFLDVNGTDEFGGTLEDIIRKESKVELIVHSFEQHAKNAEPTAAGQAYQNVDDSKIINDAIGSVGELSAGTVNNVKSGLSFIFSHASQSYKMRQVEKATSGELRFNADKTVDYVDKLGSDKTSTVLTPSNQNIVGDVEVSRRSSGENVTHLRVLGSGEGEHQLSTEVVSSGYSSGDKIWRTRVNQDITSQDALDSLANTLIDEMNEEFVEVNCSLKDVDVSLGDEFHVEYSEKNIDRDLRVVESTWILDGKGSRYSVVLSSRQKTRTKPEKKRKNDVENFNVGVQGTAVPINAGGGRQPVDSSHDYEMKVYYPSEVEYEHRLNVRVIGLQYRAYSSGAAAGGGSHTHDVSVTHPTHSHGVSILGTTDQNTTFGKVEDRANTGNVTSAPSGSWVSGGSFTPSVDTAQAWVYTDISVNVGSNTTTMQARVVDNGNNDFIPDSNGLEYNLGKDRTAYVQAVFGVPGNHNGDTLELEVQFDQDVSWLYDSRWNAFGIHEHDFSDFSTSSSELGTTQTETSSSTTPNHTHSVDPGIIDQGGEYPSNCDVKVNGNSQNTSFGGGSGTFEDVVNIKGALNEGQVNTIEVTSDTLGHIQAYVEGDVYRQILGNG